MQNFTLGSLFQVEGGGASQKSPGNIKQTTRNINSDLRGKFKNIYTPKNFQRGQIAKHIKEWQKLTSDKFILQMVREDIIKFENDIPVKHYPRNPNFFSRGGGRNPSYLGRNVT